MAGLLTFDPFRELERFARVAPRPSNGYIPFDVVKSDDAYRLSFDLPGIDPETIDVTVDGRDLTVSAERTIDIAEDDTVVRSERRAGSFSRTLHLSDGLDTDKLEAEHRFGVLTVTIPVAEAAKPRRVEIAA